MNGYIRQEIKEFFDKPFELIYEDFKSKKIETAFEDMGDTYTSSKIKKRQWNNEIEDKEFIINLVKELGLREEPLIIFNKGKTETSILFKANEIFYATGLIVLENCNSRSYALAIKDIITSGNYLKVLKVNEEVSNNKQVIVIQYEIGIPIGLNSDFTEQILIMTNYKAYSYCVNAICKKGIAFGEKYDFRNLEEFYAFYNSNYSQALDCFQSDDFMRWLTLNNYKKEIDLYRKFRLNGNAEQRLQNFLQVLNFDVTPVLSTKFIEDTLTIRNLGKGCLYGIVECTGKITADKYQWSLEDPNNEINIICRGNGTLRVLSNGGVSNIDVSAAFENEVGCRRYDLQYNFKWFGKSHFKVEGIYEIPKISATNSYVNFFLDSNFDIIIERDITFTERLRGFLNRKKLTTNLKICYPEKIYNVNISIG